MPQIFRQFIAFFGVGIAAAVVHYGLLIGLVEIWHAAPVPATLAGYLGGGALSYWLNRRHVYDTARTHAEAGWRFALVAAIGFCLTWLAMHVLVERLAVPYLLAQLITTGLVMLFSFTAHKRFSFADKA